MKCIYQAQEPRVLSFLSVVWIFPKKDMYVLARCYGRTMWLTAATPQV